MLFEDLEELAPGRTKVLFVSNQKLPFEESYGIYTDIEYKPTKEFFVADNYDMIGIILDEGDSIPVNLIHNTNALVLIFLKQGMDFRDYAAYAHYHYQSFEEAVSCIQMILDYFSYPGLIGTDFQDLRLLLNHSGQMTFISIPYSPNLDVIPKLLEESIKAPIGAVGLISGNVNRLALTEISNSFKLVISSIPDISMIYTAIPKENALEDKYQLLFLEE